MTLRIRDVIIEDEEDTVADLSQEDRIKLNQANIRRVLASKGKLKGNFYFAMKGEDVVITTTLGRRDKTGRQVLQEGKKLRREIRATKFCRGIFCSLNTLKQETDPSARIVAKKPEFVITKGTATPKQVQRALRKLGKDHPELSVLRRVVVHLPDEAPEEDPETLSTEDEAAIDRDLALDATDLQEAVLREIRETPDVVISLEDLYSEDDFLDEAEEVAEECRARLEALEREEEADVAVVEEARREYLEALVAAGADVGSIDTPEPEIVDAMKRAGELLALTNKRKHLSEQIARIHDEVAEHDDDDTWMAEHEESDMRSLYLALADLEDVAEELARIGQDAGSHVTVATGQVEATARRFKFSDSTSDTPRPRGFQLFVVLPLENFPTITLSRITEGMSLHALRVRVARESGIYLDDLKEMRFILGSADLYDDSGTLGEQGVHAESTVRVQIRVRGGYGERDAVSATLAMRRGNVAPQIKETHGASSAGMQWGRWLKDQTKYGKTIAKEALFKGDAAKIMPGVNPRSKRQVDAWWAKNWLHVHALVQQVTGGGNCGEFAAVVHSHLVTNTDSDQYSYQIGMTGAWDHALVVTSPSNVDKLEDLDDDTATVADGWYNTNVITWGEFKSGKNCYNAHITNDELDTCKVCKKSSGHGCGKEKGKSKCEGFVALHDKQQCGTSGLTDEAKIAITGLIQDRWDAFKATPTYAQWLKEYEGLADKKDQLRPYVSVERSVLSKVKRARTELAKARKKAEGKEASHPSHEALRKAQAKRDKALADGLKTLQEELRKLQGHERYLAKVEGLFAKMTRSEITTQAAGEVLDDPATWALLTSDTNWFFEIPMSGSLEERRTIAQMNQKLHKLMRENNPSYIPELKELFRDGYIDEDSFLDQLCSVFTKSPKFQARIFEEEALYQKIFDAMIAGDHGVDLSDYGQRLDDVQFMRFCVYDGGMAAVTAQPFLANRLAGQMNALTEGAFLDLFNRMSDEAVLEYFRSSEPSGNHIVENTEAREKLFALFDALPDAELKAILGERAYVIDAYFSGGNDGVPIASDERQARFNDLYDD